MLEIGIIVALLIFVLWIVCVAAYWLIKLVCKVMRIRVPLWLVAIFEIFTRR